MNPFENGQRVGFSWGVVGKEIRRVCFICNDVNPDGYLSQNHVAFEPALRKTIYPPAKIPVKVVFVETPKVASDGGVDADEQIVYTQTHLPSLDTIPSLWEDFEPTEDYFPPLP